MRSCSGRPAARVVADGLRRTAGVRFATWFTVGLAALSLAGCTPSENGQSSDEVKAAFRDAGVSLTERLSGVPPGRGVLLSGNVGGEFFVAVYADEQDAEAAYKVVRSHASPYSFDRLEGNVLVSGEDLTALDRMNVLDALNRLS